MREIGYSADLISIESNCRRPFLVRTVCKKGGLARVNEQAVSFHLEAANSAANRRSLRVERFTEPVFQGLRLRLLAGRNGARRGEHQRRPMKDVATQPLVDHLGEADIIMEKNTGNENNKQERPKDRLVSAPAEKAPEKSASGLRAMGAPMAIRVTSGWRQSKTGLVTDFRSEQQR